MWLDRYMAIPFADRGRSFEGADCFGLYMLMLAYEAGVSVMEPGVSYEVDARAVALKVEAEIMSGRWSCIAHGNGAAVKDKAEKFDAVVMTAHVRSGMAVVASVLHIGVAVGGGMMIHTEKPGGCVYLSLDHADVINRIKAIYRPQRLCA